MNSKHFYFICLATESLTGGLLERFCLLCFIIIFHVCPLLDHSVKNNVD